MPTQLTEEELKLRNRKYQQKFRRNNREHLREYHAQWRRLNKDKLKAYRVKRILKELNHD